uniref:Ring finger protein 220 n=1 Tax=Taeniopygia guttata TaxID=59729 RepID=A0A674G9U8_TAEGU
MEALLHLSTPVPCHENFSCGPHIPFPAGPDSAPATRPGVKMTVPFICTFLDPAAWSPHGALAKSRARPTAQYSIPAQSHSSADALNGFEDSSETVGKLDSAHNMNFSFLLQSILLSASIKREGDSPTASPHSSDDIHHSDRYQTFLRVRANRQTRLNARIGKMKRRKQDEGQVCPLCSRPLSGSEEEMSRHVEQCLAKREGSCMTEDDSVDIENENGNRFEEYEWCGQKRIRATTLLEGGFRGSGFIMCSGKENPDSDADLDVDGDDTLEYGKPQYTEADIIPCTGEEPGEAKEREALRGAVLNGGTPSTRITPEFSKWASDEMPSTSNGESSKQETMQKTCKNSDIEKITEDSAVTTFEALKARVRELERQLSRGDRYKCLICMGAKKLCPQCNTITSPGDLRRIYL